MTRPDLEGMKEKAEKAGEAFRSPWARDEHALGIWAPSERGGETKFLDVRGWGYLTGHGHGALGLSADEAKARQTSVADHIVSASPANTIALVDYAQKLEAMLKEARAVVEAAQFIASDRSAGGRMLTPRLHATAVFADCRTFLRRLNQTIPEDKGHE